MLQLISLYQLIDSLIINHAIHHQSIIKNHIFTISEPLGAAGLPPPRSASMEQMKQQQQQKSQGQGRVKVIMSQKYNNPLMLYSADNVIDTFSTQVGSILQDYQQWPSKVEFGSEKYCETRALDWTLGCIYNDVVLHYLKYFASAGIFYLILCLQIFLHIFPVYSTYCSTQQFFFRFIPN